MRDEDRDSKSGAAPGDQWRIGHGDPANLSARKKTTEHDCTDAMEPVPGNGRNAEAFVVGL